MVNPKYSRSRRKSFVLPGWIKNFASSSILNCYCIDERSPSAGRSDADNRMARYKEDPLAAAGHANRLTPLQRKVIKWLTQNIGGGGQTRRPLPMGSLSRSKNDANKSSRRKSVFNASHSSEEVPGTGSTGKPFHPCSRCYTCEKKNPYIWGNVVVLFWMNHPLEPHIYAFLSNFGHPSSKKVDFGIHWGLTLLEVKLNHFGACDVWTSGTAFQQVLKVQSL